MNRVELQKSKKGKKRNVIGAITIRFWEGEENVFNKLLELKNKCKVTLVDIVKNLIKYKEVYIINIEDVTPINIEYLNQLTKIGNNINQIAKVLHIANQKGELDDKFLSAAMEELREIRMNDIAGLKRCVIDGVKEVKYYMNSVLDTKRMIKEGIHVPADELKKVANEHITIRE